MFGIDNNRLTMALLGILLILVLFVCLILLIKVFDIGPERSQASAATTEVVAEMSPALADTVVAASDGEPDDVSGRQFPVGSFLGLYGGEVHICPASAPQPAWRGERGAVGADWTWIAGEEGDAPHCRRNGFIGISALAAPALIALAQSPYDAGLTGPDCMPSPAATAMASATATPTAQDEAPDGAQAGVSVYRGVEALCRGDFGGRAEEDRAILPALHAATGEIAAIGASLGVYGGRDVTCVADSQAIRTLTDDQWDFAHAADGGTPGVCYRILRAVSKEGCLRAASDADIEEGIMRRLAETDPRGLTDAERIEWRRLLLASGGSEPFAACPMYWSEPAGAGNGNKRNERYRSCISEWSEELGLFSFGKGLRQARMEDGIRMNYAELTRAQAEALREWLDEGHGGAANDCHLYYPQLYTGRWTPLE